MEKAPHSGKALKEQAEKLYDEIADREGLDEYGDDIPDVDDDPEADDPVLAEDDNDGDEIRDEPVGEDDSPGDEEDAETVAKTKNDVPTPSQGAGPEAPHTWPQEWKDAYNQIDSVEVRQAVHEMTGHMNKAFTQRMTELSEMRRDQEAITRAMTPHAERLQRAGIAPDVAVARALGWDAHISKDPVQGWLDYGKALGIEPAQVLQAQQAETRYMTPAERQVMEQTQGITQRLEANERRVAQWMESQQQRENSEREARAKHTLLRFMNAKDDAGNLLHPHVDQVAGVMTRLIEANAAPDLEAAYTMAAANNPQIREAREKLRKANQVKGAQEKANKVRKASKSGIVAKGGGKPGKSPRTTEQIVSANYDKIANG
jgi:hypothetical protein